MDQVNQGIEDLNLQSYAFTTVAAIVGFVDSTLFLSLTRTCIDAN